MAEETITQNPLPDDVHVASADGAGAGGSAATQDFVIRASDLKQALGKDFKDGETALKALKDTFSYVGKAGQIEKEYQELKSKAGSVTSTPVDGELAQQVKEMREDLWFEKNPQYKSVRPIIKKMGNDPHSVVESPEFKEFFPKVQGYEETQKLKTVLESNPRLASSSDKITKAREIANKRGRQGEAGELATKSVMEAFGMDES